MNEHDRRVRQRELANKYLNEMIREHRDCDESYFDAQARLAFEVGKTGDQFRMLLAVLDDPNNDPNLVPPTGG
ncbi:MAG: hypothetical protein AB7G08_31955 [Hyphomicrobiaceae bacterium]